MTDTTDNTDRTNSCDVEISSGDVKFAYVAQPQIAQQII